MAAFKISATVVGLALSLAGLSSLEAVSRPKALEGPIPAFVERVVDGDTLVVRARIWLGQELKILVRINGIDAPELRARCKQERKMALSARKLVKRLVGQRKVTLTHIRQGKYAGRVIAEVTDKSGSLLSTKLLKANLVRPYTRGRRKSWCKKNAVRPYQKAHITSRVRSGVKTVAP